MFGANPDWNFHHALPDMVFPHHPPRFWYVLRITLSPTLRTSGKSCTPQSGILNNGSGVRLWPSLNSRNACSLPREKSFSGLPEISGEVWS